LFFALQFFFDLDALNQSNMPEKTQSFPLAGYNLEDALSLSYGAFLHLGWLPQFAGPVRLIGYSKTTWGKPHEIITAEAADETVSLKSELPENAAWDMMKKNQKNLQKFAAALEVVKPQATPEKLAQWREELNKLRQTTDAVVEEKQKENEEVEKVMNLSAGKKTVTYGIMGINVAVFVLMAITGVSLFEPTNLDIVHWGANYQPLTVDEGQWWRLLTNIFVHIGLIHILFNMYALYMVGIYLEPMLGKSRYAVAYLCTGIFASLTSIGWHGDEVISAGASGAIFGLYGVFLALLTTNLIPKSARKALLQSIGIFVVYNLVYGMKSGIDNAAHLGGVVSGFVIGYLYYPTLKNPTPAKSRSIAGAVLTATVIVLCVIIYRS